jgi:hypothetical protein
MRVRTGVFGVCARLPICVRPNVMFEVKERERSKIQSLPLYSMKYLIYSMQCSADSFVCELCSYYYVDLNS